MSTPNDATSDVALIDQVNQIVQSIPKGRVMSYGAVGKRCEPPISGYICGRTMHSATNGSGVPWWRVVGKDSNLPIRKRNPLLSAEQRKRLENENVNFDGKGRVLMERFGVE